MRYQVLLPHRPTDPRDMDFPDTAALAEVLPVAAICTTEREAARSVRERFRNAIGMPMVVDLGSGAITLLGFVDDPQTPVDPDGEIPFVCFVRVLADSDADRAYLAKLQKMGKSPYNRELWKMPVHRAELARRMRVDLRSTDLEVPAFVEASVGTNEGRLTLHVEIGDFAMSMRFEDPRVQVIVASSAGASVALDEPLSPTVSGPAATVLLDAVVDPADLDAIRGGEL